MKIVLKSLYAVTIPFVYVLFGPLVIGIIMAITSLSNQSNGDIRFSEIIGGIVAVQVMGFVPAAISGVLHSICSLCFGIRLQKRIFVGGIFGAVCGTAGLSASLVPAIGVGELTCGIKVLLFFGALPGFVSGMVASVAIRVWDLKFWVEQVAGGDAVR